MQLGKYQLIRKLATGGMAEVFLAKAAGPMGFEKTLVLKRILPHLAEDPAFVEMFLSEAKLAAQLNHPNIVQIFDFGEADGEYFLAMEHIDGPNLRMLLKRANALGMVLPPALCARLIASACEGLAFAHDFREPATGELLGLIHRDISPDNILVSRQGAVKVVDFGIAKAGGQSHKTQSGVIKGKLAYMPPEQIRAKQLDRRVDVYALGVVFYELLTGHKPFEATTDASLMQTILFEEMVPAVQHRPDLPESVQRILERALAKDREQRYADCLALEAELEEFILSIGKPVTTQQIVQLVAQIAPSTDAPMPTPQSGTPRSGPRPSTTPVHTPAPVSVRTGPGTRSEPRPAHAPRTGDMVAPVEATSEEPPAKTVPLTAPEVTTPKEQHTSTPPRQPHRWLPAVVGAVLLVGGGGLLIWRTSSGSEPSTSPVIAQASPPAAPAVPPAESPPSPAVATPTPSEPSPTPPSTEANAPPAAKEEPHPDSHPPEATPSEAGDDSPKVAAIPAPEPSAGEPTPRDDPPSAPSNPTRRPPSSKSPQSPRGNAASSSRPQVAGKGTFSFRVRPFATVIVNGKSLGQTPFDPVEFPAGTYKIRFVNDDLKKNVTQTHELKPGENKVIKLNLEE
jgi:serine/threonine protein kinase